MLDAIFFSIIVPVYNIENYIGNCIESILNQEFQNYEILVVDDGSPDNSINVVKQYNDERIKILSKKNGGLSSARNYGIQNSSGKFLIFIDGDDTIAKPNFLQCLYSM